MLKLSHHIYWLNNKSVKTPIVNDLLHISQETNQFSNYGPLVNLLESTIRCLLHISNSKSVIATNNGTSALHALATGIRMFHDKQLAFATQAFTFPSSAQGPLSDCCILDIDRDGGLDISLIPPHVDGIIVTNIFGNVVDINKYVQWAKNNNKLLLFDNAATPFTMYDNDNCCNYGTGSIISFHHTKPLGFGEGGAIIVDSKYEQHIRRCLNFGISSDSCWNKQCSNFKMSDISAAYIIQYIENFNTIINKHKQLYELFKTEVDMIDGVRLFPNYSDDIPFVACFPVIFRNKEHSSPKYYNDMGIYCKKYYNPLKLLPISQYLYDHILCFPCHVDMTNNDIAYVIDAIKNITSYTI